MASSVVATTLSALAPLVTAATYAQPCKTIAECTHGEYHLSELPNYFLHPHHRFWILAHVILMTIAWVFILPTATMFSISKSRYTPAWHLLMLATNGLGFFAGAIYNWSTPDLYVHNAHHTMGWISAIFLIVWFLISLILLNSKSRVSRSSSATSPLLNQSQEQQSQAYHPVGQADSRWSQESNARTAVSLDSSDRRHHSFGAERSSSVGIEMSSSIDTAAARKEHRLYNGENEDDDDDAQGSTSSASSSVFSFPGTSSLSSKLGALVSHKLCRHIRGMPLTALRAISHVFDRTIMQLGFTIITTGIVTYAGFYRDREVFVGLAHSIKGGIFFWIGLFAIARWAGAFADLGWAWNVKPPASAVGHAKFNTPSFEFFESLLIFLYGASNVWIEHFNGKTWNPVDFEHVGISVLFIGGGLLGLLTESTRVRKFLNAGMEVANYNAQASSSPSGSSSAPNNSAPDYTPASNATVESPTWAAPISTHVPLNMIPALTIGMLGIILSVHEQHSPLATALHGIWGGLFLVGSAFRLITYSLHYIRPPVSHYPSRPPTELLTGFTYAMGGLLLMASARDPIMAMEAARLDAMVAFVVTAGIVGVLCAWTVVVMAIKGWAVRMEHSSQLAALRTQVAGA